VKVKELEVLAEAVRTENLRREALNAQARSGPSVLLDLALSNRYFFNH
jgi:hypothetical protein